MRRFPPYTPAMRPPPAFSVTTNPAVPSISGQTGCTSSSSSRDQHAGGGRPHHLRPGPRVGRHEPILLRRRSVREGQGGPAPPAAPLSPGNNEGMVGAGACRQRAGCGVNSASDTPRHFTPAKHLLSVTYVAGVGDKSWRDNYEGKALMGAQMDVDATLRPPT